MNIRSFRPALLAAIFLLIATLPGVAAADDDPSYGVGLARTTYLVGDTVFNSPDSQDWAALSPNFTLREGDHLWAGDNSKMEVGFAGGNYAWLNYDSELDMTKLESTDKGYTLQTGLPSGEASFMVRRPRVGVVFQVDAPNASVRAYGEARFRVSVLSDGSSQVGVGDGSVEVESDKGITDLKPGEMAEVASDGEVNITSLPAQDDWDRWVDSRAHIYARPGRSARYLPANMDSYAYEFDQGGRWVDAPDYGNVWVPTVALGWSPYSNGRWCWVGGDYVWLPYDPWYAPFHYGRWTWSVSIGWFWAPPTTTVAYWSPGYVSWVSGPSYVGWVPLAPGEVYYGYGYYGPHSVNVYKTKVVNVTNVYVNSRVNNGVVIVNKNNFVQGNVTRVAIKNVRDPKQNPFLDPRRANARLIAAPPVKEIKPTRALMLPKPHVRPAPKALPPARVQKLVPVVTKRPVAVKKDFSVFRPNAAPKRLNKEALRQRGPAPQAAPAKQFRGKEARPGAAPQKAPGKVFKGGRPAPPEKRVQPGRPAPETRQKAVPQERSRGRNLEAPGRARPAPPRGTERPAPPARERGIAPAPRETGRPAPPPKHEPKALPRGGGNKGPGRARPAPPIERQAPPVGGRPQQRAPEVAPKTRPAPPGRERSFIAPSQRPAQEARPVAPPAAKKEGKAKGEGKKKKEQEKKDEGR